MPKPTMPRFAIPQEHKEWLKERAKKECTTETAIVRRMIANAYSKRNVRSTND